MNYWPYFAILGVTILAIWAFLRGRKYPYHAKGRLLTDAELRFYPVLQAAIPSDCTIMAKVRLADIIDCAQSHWQSGWGRFIAAKHIDFVVIDATTTDIKLCVELDDSTHQLPERQARDAFVDKALLGARVPLLRVNVTARYDTRWLENQIKMALEQGYRQV